MKNRVDKTSSSFQYFSTIQKKSYHNQIINKVSIDNSRIHAHKNQNITSFYHKDLTNILQNSLESETSVPNITSLPIGNTLGVKTSVLSFARTLLQNNISSINNFTFHKSREIKHSLESETSVPNITRLPIGNTLGVKTSVPSFARTLLQNSILDYDQDINNQTKISRKNTTIIYNKEKEKTVLSEPIIDEKVLKKVIKETNMVENSHYEPSKVVEHSVNDLHPYDIKKLATKIYPFIINQWQKEFERRGVFYG
jgi:hypothetical protein